MKPLFITFEGPDGSGKSTHLRTTAERLRRAGVAVTVTKEPGGTPLGEGIREIFLDRRLERVDGVAELLMLFASRRQLLLDVVDPALARGEHVLCDRFSDSTYAYQGGGRGVDEELIAAVDDLATGSRRPDRTILFDLPPSVAQDRRLSSSASSKGKGPDRLDSEALEFYRSVRDAFLERAREEGDRFRVVSSAGHRDETAAAVARALHDLFPGVA